MYNYANKITAIRVKPENLKRDQDIFVVYFIAGKKREKTNTIEKLFPLTLKGPITTAADDKF